MLIYRFKIWFEDQDEFFREFELRSDQTFEDLFLAFISNLNLDTTTLSSFFICDHKFRKRTEISLVEMNAGAEENGGKKVLVMQHCRLNDYIDDPHQKLLLAYDYLNYWTFYIELLKITRSNPDHRYPRLHKSGGEVPRELIYKPDSFIPVEDELIDDSFSEGEYSAEDIDILEGEEDFLGAGDENLERFDDEKDL